MGLGVGVGDRVGYLNLALALALALALSLALSLACHPRGEHGERRDHQVGPGHAEVELEVREEGDGLQS